MIMTFPRKDFSKSIAISVLCLCATTSCADDFIDSPDVDPITGGVGITCPTDPTSPNTYRNYGALILYRDEEEIPLYEGYQEDPFDGTYVEMTGEDHVTTDKYFMRAVYLTQYDSDKKPDLRKGIALPDSVRDAFEKLNRAYRNSLPRPKITGFNPSSVSRVNVFLPEWNIPPVETFDPTVTMGGPLRAALKRKALGVDGTGHDSADRTRKGLKWVHNGRGMNATFTSDKHNLMLYGVENNVFEESSEDRVQLRRRYQYYPEVYATVIYTDPSDNKRTKFYVTIQGNKKKTINVRRDGVDELE